MGLREVFRKILRQDEAFTVHEQVVSETYRRSGQQAIPVDPQSVASAASILESALAMTEDVSADTQVGLLMTQKELASFVCYMRQLDTAYRAQAKFIAKRVKTASDSFTGYTHELETTEEAAEVSPECYEQLTGQSARQAASRQRGEQPPVDAGHVPLAKR